MWAIVCAGTTISSLPMTSTTTTLCPTSNSSPRVRHFHSVAPTIGTLKRTVPTLSAVGSTVIIPFSPIITLPPNPALVRSTDNGFTNLNQMAIIISDKINHKIIWNACGNGINQLSKATITAAIPNHKVAKVVKNISEIIRIPPSTSQCHGSNTNITSSLIMFLLLFILALLSNARRAITCAKSGIYLLYAQKNDRRSGRFLRIVLVTLRL